MSIGPGRRARRTSRVRGPVRAIASIAIVVALSFGLWMLGTTNPASGSTATRSASGAARVARQTAPTTASNRRAAVRDAKGLLQAVVPPAGAVLRASGTAVGAHARGLTAALASAVAYRRWTVADDPESVLSFVQAHLPGGSTVVSTGSSGPGFMRSVVRSWPPRVGVLDVRWLEIEVRALASGATQLYAESQSQWVVVRPKGEHIPADVREVDITDGWPGKDPFLSRQVTDRANVHRLVRLFNSLEIVQPVGINCPALTPVPVVEIGFRLGGSGRLVARATVSSTASFSWPASVPGWACIPVDLNIGGRNWTPLAGNVITPIEHLLHIRLARHH